MHLKYYFQRIEGKQIRCTEVIEFTNEGIQIMFAALQDSFVYQKKTFLSIFVVKY